MAPADKKTAKKAAKKKTSVRKTKPSTASAKPSERKAKTASAPPASAPQVRADKTAKAAAGMVEIKLVRSLIGSSPRQRAVVAGIGLRRMNQIVKRQDTKEIRGMVAKVPHLVSILA
jgi:large subunit ribosomal protein L30